MTTDTMITGTTADYNCSGGKKTPEEEGEDAQLANRGEMHSKGHR